MSSCQVWFIDGEGIKHSVEIDADSLYEAVFLALKTFRQHDCIPSEATPLQVEMRTSVIHEVTLRKVRQWVRAGPKSPRDSLLKDRLRGILE